MSTFYFIYFCALPPRALRGLGPARGPKKPSLEVLRLWDPLGLHGRAVGDEGAGPVRDPTLGRPVEGGPQGLRLLELGVAGRVQVHLRQLEADPLGRTLEAPERGGHPGDANTHRALV